MEKLTIHKARAFANIPFVRGVATFQIGSVVTMSAGFVSSVLYARLLGVSQFGLFAVISAFVGLLTLFTSYGQETTGATFLAESMGRKDLQTARAVLRYFAQATGVSTMLYLALFWLAPYIAAFTQQQPDIGLYARVLLLNTLLQSANVLLFMALQVQRRIAAVTVIENTIDILQIALSVALILMGWDIWGILCGTLFVTIAATPVLLMLYDRSARTQGLPTVMQLLGDMWKGGTGIYWRQGGWIALDQNIGKNLYPNLFYLVLSATTSLQTVGVFRIAFRLATLPGTFIMPSITRMTTFAIPRIASADPKQLLQSCKKVIIGAMGISTLATIGAAVVAPPLIPLVYGKAFVMAIPVFLALLPINIIASVHVISIPLLRVYKRVWIISITNAVGIVIGIGAYFLLHLWLPTLAAISGGILLFHLNSLALFVYLFTVVRRKKLA